MRPWNTASAKSSKTMRQRFPTKRGNGFNIRRLGGCFIILLASTCCVRQANGRLSSISPRSISTCFASLGHRTCGFMTSEIRKNHRGGAECRLYSYREAERNLGTLNGQPRSVNNHAQVKRMTDQVGRLLAEQNGIPPAAQECAPPARDLIMQVDGGHIPIQEKDQRSFEALAAIVYRPWNIRAVDKHHREITEKTCVMSAKDDHLQSITTYLIHAAMKQGLYSETQVTALADGATNCWTVVLAMKPYCAALDCILDWFHIGKKFQTVKNALGEAFEASLESAKWKLWHGKAEETLAKLALLRDNITDEAQKSKMTGLYNFIYRNQAYIVNYDEREREHKTYTSQVAESHIDALINARHKKTGKMQWSREGADNVLQIRATMASKEWTSKWQSTVLSALGAAA